MSDETVEVTVRLPKPKPGFSDWVEGEAKDAASASEFMLSTRSFISRRVAPPERMVTLTLPESDVRGLADEGLFPIGGWYRFKDAARKALAEAPVCEVPSHVQPCSIDSGGRHWLAQGAQEVCGLPVRIKWVGTDNVETQSEYPCALPKGHAGVHAP